ncbi:MAG: DUF2877 domain-containing protein, partial [bacterium]
EPFRARGAQGQVLATFRRSAYVAFSGSEEAVVALVAPDLGRGPLSLPAEGVSWACLRPGDPVRLASFCLQAGEQTLDLDGAARWDPTLPRVRPDPLQVRRCCEWLVASAPPESLAALVPHLLRGRGPSLRDWHRRALEGARALSAGAYASGCELLCGLGPGLTPSGDDFLCGWMLALHLHGRPRETLLQHVRGTHRIARAYLRAAAAGFASEAWHRLAASLQGGHWGAAAREVLSAGETSGADTLAGFLAGLVAGAGCRPVRPVPVP